MLVTSGKAESDGQEFIEASLVFLIDDFMPKLLHCVEAMSDEDIWWRPNEQSNSAGNLILHLCGNMRQWIVGGIGGVNFNRDRDAEFAERRPVQKAQLIAKIREASEDVNKVLRSLSETRLMERYPIQTYSTTCLQAIYHVVEHFSYHLGQILYIYKLRTGVDPGFYRHLSSR